MTELRNGVEEMMGSGDEEMMGSGDEEVETQRKCGDDEMIKTRKGLVRNHTDLEVYQRSFEAAMKVFRCSKSFPKEETYSLTDQVRRSSRSVSANVAEAWRKRRYEAAFVSKLSDAETEAAETQVWLQFAVECEYLPKELARPLYREFDQIIGMLVRMIKQSQNWILK